MATRKTDNTTAKLIINDNVPKWMYKWLTAAKELILPEWEVDVISEVPDPENPDCMGMVWYNSDYLTAMIKLNPNLHNDRDAHYAILHEFTHPLLDGFNQAMNKTFETAHYGKNRYEYDHAKESFEVSRTSVNEATTTRVSRIFYHLLKERFEK